MIKGISQNFSPDNLPSDYGYHAKNILLSKYLNEVVNEKGTKRVEAFASAGATNIIGVIPFGEKVILFHKGAAVISNQQLLVNGDFSGQGPWEQIGTGWTFGNDAIHSNNISGPDSAYETPLFYQQIPLIAGTNITVSVQVQANTGWNYGFVCEYHFLTVDNVIIDTKYLGDVPTGLSSGTFNSVTTVPPGAAKIGFTVRTSVMTGTNSISFTSASVLGTIQDNGDQIGVYDEVTQTYTVKVTRTDLRFDPAFPITGRAKLNTKGELIVAFTDKNETPKYINLDSALPSDSITLYNLFLLSKNPDIVAETLEGGGSFKTGVYFASTQYVDSNKAGSTYSQLSNPVYITIYPTLQDPNTTQGSDGGQTTNKAIKLTLTNLDPSFTRLRIALISKINDVTTAKLYKEVSYAGTSATVVVNGGELTTDLGVEEVLTINQVFDKVGEIESLNDQLFLADVTTAEITDFQRLFNKVTIEWISNPKYNILDSSATEVYPKDGSVKTFLHDEVYAFYGQVELLNGRWSEWFHVPGLALTSAQRNGSTESNGVKINGGAPKIYQIQDTCTYDGSQGNLSSDPTAYAYGKMGVWENENEVYPPSFPDLAGQKVRHHRFPSTRYMKENVYTSNSQKYLLSMWDTLGVRFNFNGVPEEFSGKYRSIRFGYAKRVVSDITVLGYDLVQHGAMPQDDAAGEFNPSVITSAAGNWEINAEGVDNDIRATTDYVRLHSPDIFQFRPSVTDIYLSNILKVKINDLNHAFSNNEPWGRLSNTNDVWTYVTNIRYSDTQDLLAASNRYKKLTNTRYVLNNVILGDQLGTINNSLNEEVVFGKLESSLGIDISGVDSGGGLRTNLGSSPDSPNLYEETIITTVKTIKTDLFVNFVDQQVVPINKIIRNTNVSTIVQGDGDGFICYYSFLCMASAPSLTGAFNYNSDDGVRCVKAFLCESRFNLNQRYQKDGDYNTYSFPFSGSNVLSDATEYWYAKLSQTNCPVNNFAYNKDNHALNDLEQYGVYNHTIEYNNQLPYAIARSLKANRASDLDDGWRVFKPNDIFYTVRDKGFIINLVAWGTDSLLIHHQRALFRTRDKAVLQTDITNISLGSGDLFAIEPAEVVPTQDGYGGTQHKFACLLCEAGYVFIDQHVGEMFIYKGGDNYITLSKGYRQLFIEAFRNNVIADNPFNATGISLAFDKENYRLLLSLKASPQFTMSFDLVKEEWACFHDYKADYIFNTRKNLYSFKGVQLFQHNVGPTGNFYDVVYPSFVDIVINEQPDKEKILQSIDWITRVIKNGTPNYKETITHITVWNDYFCTGRIEVKPQINIAEYELKNTSQRLRAWHFNELKDVVKDTLSPFVGGIFDDYMPISSNLDSELAWFEKEQITGKYFIIRLEYSNFEDKLVYLRRVIGNIKEAYA